MKLLIGKLTVLILFVFSFQMAQAQIPINDDQKKLLEQIKKKMDETELGLIAESESTFGQAKSILENVSAEDLEIEKLFIKGSNPKAEKKAVNVKRNRIEAAKLYEKGYNMLFEACESRLKQINFPEEPKQTKAKDFSNQSNETMTGAVTKGDDYKYLKDKDLETLRYDDLKSRIENVNKMFIEGISMEFDAWTTYFSQFKPEPEPVKEQEKQSADSTTKDSVQTTNITTSATPVSNNLVQTSLPSMPTKSEIEGSVIGNAVVEQTQTNTNNSTTQKNNLTKTNKPQSAKTKAQRKVQNEIISEKENQVLDTEATKNVVASSDIKSTAANVELSKPSKASKAKTNTNKAHHSISTEPSNPSTSLKGTVYLVQVLAIQRGKLSNSAKSQLISGNKKLYEDYENELYKYRLGDFNNEEEAIKFKQEYGKGSFVTKLIDGIRQMDYINK